jgi:quercetin dioxygenase-like cupin family protein
MAMMAAVAFVGAVVGCNGAPMTGGMKTTVAHTDQTPKKVTDWGSLAWAVSGEAGNCETMTLGRVSIKAGQANPHHRHGNCDELLYLISGELDHYASDVGTLRMNPGDVIVIPTGVTHNARCVSTDDAEMIVIYSSPKREFEPVPHAVVKAPN